MLVTEYERVIRPLQAKYCFSCHGATKPKGGIDLASRKGIEKPHAWKEVWERLRSRQMPPLGKPQPTAVERERMVAWIESVFAHETLDGQADPGPLRPRRLNAREYINTVRDLFVTGGKPSVRKTSFEPLKDGRISHDVATVNRITQAVKDDGYKFSRVVIEVARSYPFRNCR